MSTVLKAVSFSLLFALAQTSYTFFSRTFENEQAFCSGQPQAWSSNATSVFALPSYTQESSSNATSAFALPPPTVLGQNPLPDAFSFRVVGTSNESVLAYEHYDITQVSKSIINDLVFGILDFIFNVISSISSLTCTVVIFIADSISQYTQLIIQDLISEIYAIAHILTLLLFGIVKVAIDLAIFFANYIYENVLGLFEYWPLWVFLYFLHEFVDLVPLIERQPKLGLVVGAIVYPPSILCFLLVGLVYTVGPECGLSPRDWVLAPRYWGSISWIGHRLNKKAFDKLVKYYRRLSLVILGIACSFAFLNSFLLEPPPP